MPIDPMEFFKMDKISDDIFVLGPNVILRLTVGLSKINSDGKRFYFYKEFEYKSKAKDQDTLITIRRSFDYYLSLENVQKNRVTDDKAFIRMGPSELVKFKSQINEAVSWFTSKRHKALFAKNKGKIVLTNPVPESTLGGYPQNKFIRIIPTVIEKSNGQDELGVEIDLSSYDNYVCMSVDKLMGLQDILSTFNIYQAAQGMVNFIGFHPGTNRFSMVNSNSSRIISEDEFTGSIEGIDDRTINKKKNISSLE